ncbi:unnamed protein product, partial [Cylicostephanus goldi]
LYIPTNRKKRELAQIYLLSNGNVAPSGVARVVRFDGSSSGYALPPCSAAVGGFQVQQGFSGGGYMGPQSPSMPNAQPVDLCAKCPAAGGGGAGQLLGLITGQLDMSKLNDLYLSIQLLNTQATSNDFIIDLSGEFSPNAQGSTVLPMTPFGAFPVAFPPQYDNHMVEIILSDYTINSLLYWLHR